MKNILLIGKPACGKGTQTKLLQERLNLYPIAMGEILRKHKENGTSIGKMATELDKEGKLMPNHIIIEIMRNEILDKRDSVKGFIFDGAVRTIEQAVELKRLMDDLNMPLEVVHIGVSDGVAVSRSLKRGETGGRIEDSNVSIIHNRLDIFKRTTVPALDIFDNYWKVDGEQDIEDIFDELEGIMSFTPRSANSWVARNMDNIFVFGALGIGVTIKNFVSVEIASYVLLHIMMIALWFRFKIIQPQVSKRLLVFVLGMGISLPNIIAYVGGIQHGIYYMVFMYILMVMTAFKKYIYDDNNK